MPRVCHQAVCNKVSNIIYNIYGVVLLSFVVSFDYSGMSGT